MLRYISLLWDPGNQDGSETAYKLSRDIQNSGTPWSIAIQIPGLHVYYVTSGETAGNLCSQKTRLGAVLGVIFERTEMTGEEVPSALLQEGQMELVVKTSGSHLIDNYWGWYVAFFRDDVDGTSHVLRGPMSDLPCFLTKRHGVHIFFSRVADCDDLRLGFSVDWNYLCVHLGHKEVRGPHTALREVSEIEVGERVSIRSGPPARHYLWHPCDVAKSDSIGKVEAATRTLRAVTQSCVRSWTSRHRSVIHRLSGGLDSSIVLACMSRMPSPPLITCITSYSPGGNDDERKFARLAATWANCRLIERERNTELKLDIFKHLNRIPRPLRDYTGYEAHRAHADLATDLGASGMVCGAQGDNLFQQSAHIFATAEYLSRHGISRGVLSVALGAAQRGRLSVWHTLASGIRDGLLASRPNQWSEYLDGLVADSQGISMRGLLTADARDTAKDCRTTYRHPWFDNCADVPRAKLWMISQMNAEMSYNSQFSRPTDPTSVAPFISQPLVEVCLRIESHLNVHEGWDRAIARRAFAEELPPEILTRVGKGGPDSWTKETIYKNIPFLRDFLLNGLLVKERLIDRVALEEAIAFAPRKSRFSTNDIITQLYNEGWLRNWASVPRESSGFQFAKTEDVGS
jgi:asparagine synthase (glutamine-hydrolysing)